MNLKALVGEAEDQLAVSVARVPQLRAARHDTLTVGQPLHLKQQPGRDVLLVGRVQRTLDVSRRRKPDARQPQRRPLPVFPKVSLLWLFRAVLGAQLDVDEGERTRAKLLPPALDQLRELSRVPSRGGSLCVGFLRPAQARSVPSRPKMSEATNTDPLVP